MWFLSLFSVLIPALWRACSSVRQVRTPNTTGVPVSVWTFISPCETASEMYSKCIVDPLMSTPIAIKTSYGRVADGLEAVDDPRLDSEVVEADESRSVADDGTSEPSKELGERVLEPVMMLEAGWRPTGIGERSGTSVGQGRET